MFDALAWFELLAWDGTIDDKLRNTIHDFLLIDKWRGVIDIVFLFLADPETSMRRENADKLITDVGRAMNPDFLGRLKDAYESMEDKYAGSFARVERIDTSDSHETTAQSTALQVVESILNALEEKTNR